jgi:TRAP-type uncharacterized transport system fused permease subunit
LLIYAFITGFSAFRAAALGMIAAILVTLVQIARGRELHGNPAGGRLLRWPLRVAVAVLAAGLVAALLDYGGKQLFYALALTAITLGIAVGWMRDRTLDPLETQPGESAFGVPGLAKALDSGTRDALQLIAVCAGAGIVAGVIASTGIGGRFAYLMLAIAGESKLLAMLFTMLIVIILGMGMPTTAAYAIGASVVAPGLIQIGVDKLVAHMFIFYFAVMSSITPPVAVASFAAAAMARADPWETSWKALRNGLAAFLVPFLFFYSPVLLGRGSWEEIVGALASAVVGVYLLACGTEGWFNGRLTVALRAILIVAALGLMLPEIYSTITGLVLGAAVWAWQRWQHGANPADAVPSPPMRASVAAT